MKTALLRAASLLVLALFLAHCGSESNKLSSSTRTALDTGGFRVTGISPGYQSENVARQSPIRIRMSQSVDVSSAQGSVVVTTLDGATVLEGAITTTLSIVTDDTIVFTPQQLLAPNTIYSVTVNSTLRSKSGLTPSPYIYRFSTGTFNPLGDGSISVPGAPVVEKIELWPNPAPGVRFGVYYKTNEFLNEVPEVHFSYLIGKYVMKSGPMLVKSFYGGDMSSFAMMFPDDGWGALGATAVKVETMGTPRDHDEGNKMVMDGTTRRTFKIVF